MPATRTTPVRVKAEQWVVHRPILGGFWDVRSAGIWRATFATERDAQEYAELQNLGDGNMQRRVRTRVAMRKQIIQALEAHEGDRPKTARALGLNRNTLRKRMERLRITVEPR